jgi:hypothetical protein
MLHTNPEEAVSPVSVPIHIITIEACNGDGDYVQVKLEGLTEIPSDEDLERTKKATAELFEWGFGEQPGEILVRDSMKHRAEREGEDDDG